MYSEVFLQAGIDYRTQRFLREAERDRMARSVPRRASRTKPRGGRTRVFAFRVRTRPVAQAVRECS
jgi:hypothetical protein